MITNLTDIGDRSVTGLLGMFVQVARCTQPTARVRAETQPVLGLLKSAVLVFCPQGGGRQRFGF